MTKSKKKIRLYFSLMILTVLALSGSGATKRKRTSTVQKISYCQLSLKYRRYHHQKIQVTGILSSTPNLLTFRHPECAFPEDTLLEFGTNFYATEQLKKWVEELKDFKTVRKQKLAEVTVIGTFDGHYTLGCFAPRFKLTVDKIIPLSDSFDQ